jgi:hypothetical protein
LASSTYSQPGSGLTQLFTTMFESADALLWLGALAWPAVAAAWAGRAAKHRAKGTERRQNEDDRRFALIHCPGNFRVRPLVTHQGCPTILFKPEIGKMEASFGRSNCHAKSGVEGSSVTHLFSERKVTAFQRNHRLNSRIGGHPEPTWWFSANDGLPARAANCPAAMSFRRVEQRQSLICGDESCTQSL